jgi:NAD(P)-dependent dehydrogenase (short-subunit alcohol dehydrogenase family)
LSHVAGASAPAPGGLDTTAALIEETGAAALPLVADLHDRTSLVAALGTVVDRWGGLDLLVNNAVDTGPGSMVPITELSVERLATKLEANVVAQFVLICEALPTMLAQGGGTIVDVTSHTATADPPGPVGDGRWGLAYAASKAAFHRFAPQLAVELGDRGIRTYNLDPGYVETERQQANAAALGLAGRYAGAHPVPAASRPCPPRPGELPPWGDG